MLAADDEGKKALAAYIVPITKISNIIKHSLAIDESLTRNGASPSIYITASGKRQSALVEKVKELATDILKGKLDSSMFSDAIDDLDSIPIGYVLPEKKSYASTLYSRDPNVSVSLRISNRGI